MKGGTIMLSDKEFLAFINDNSIDEINEANLRQIIDEEMEKPEDEMNPDLIEYCLDMLNKENTDISDTKSEKPVTKHISIRFKKIVSVAAVVAILFIGTLTASAVIFDVNLFDGLVEVYTDYVRINFDKSDDKADSYELLDTELAKELAENGFTDVLLPEAIFSDDFEITEITYEHFEYTSSANIYFKYKNKRDYISISKYALEELVPDVEYLHVTSNVEEIDVNGTTVYCFSQVKKLSTIAYLDGLTHYTIHLPTDLETAKEIAKTKINSNLTKDGDANEHT